MNHDLSFDSTIACVKLSDVIKSSLLRRGCLVENDRSEKVLKSGRIFENSRQIVGYLTRVFGNMDDFTGFVADLFLTRQPLT